MNSTPSPEDSAINQRLRSIFPDEVTANKVVELIVNKKPPGWGRKSQSTYYNEYYARHIQPHIDKMIEDHEAIIWHYKNFCGSSEEIMAKSTLYQRVWQSVRYLCDCLDPTGKYKKWRMLTFTRRCPKRQGIVIEYKPEYRNAQGGEPDFTPQNIISQQDEPIWRRKMDKWLEDGETTPYCQERLCLDAQEIHDLKVELNALSGIMFTVTASSVKIIRMNV